tara:strand:+ start:868 stop:1419 length:552 start_codon:yes stop_codon:yes gene_type:complete
MAKGLKRRILHTDKLKSFQKIGKRNIWPGTVLQFKYDSKGRFDRRPLILCLYVDRQKQVVHGVNFNYLSEFKVQKLFTFIHRVIKIDQRNEDIKTLNGPITRIKMTKTGEGQSERLYERVIKPRLLVEDDCYRTYSINKMSGVEACWYEIDIIKETIEAIREAKAENDTTKIDKIKTKSEKTR